MFYSFFPMVEKGIPLFLSSFLENPLDFSQENFLEKFFFQGKR